ncbi:uncharacterized protein LOC131430108 [Malaya genurostris]|uniref:uncharacterized protein LOC131430108 n=1 Tax=Malaya genurostris TaxID=325434 RepID=UPI0026F3E827|nr:uncharacterized protein LOC131430108 [Malaya genurostris]
MEHIFDADGNIYWVQCIPGDGNCLYGSLVHQIYGVSPDNTLFKRYIVQLRESVVSEIKRNLHLYYASLSINACEVISGNLSESQKVEEYLQQLLCSGFWGGEESLSAIANLHQMGITVYQENSQFHFLPQSGVETSHCKVFFRGPGDIKNHYDSVVCVRPKDFALHPSDCDYEEITIDGVILKAQRLERDPQTLFSVIGHQLTGMVLSDMSLFTLHCSVADEVERQPLSFLESCGVLCATENSLSTYAFHLRIGRHDGGVATLVCLASLLGVTIYVYNTRSGLKRLDPVNRRSIATIHILEDFEHEYSSYASVLDVHPCTDNNIISPSPFPRDNLSLALSIERRELSEPNMCISSEVKIDSRHGLQFASLNVNGCRQEKNV